jgi:uncharacterized protein YjbI with pentapeptide repeats
MKQLKNIAILILFILLFFCFPTIALAAQNTNSSLSSTKRAQAQDPLSADATVTALQKEQLVAQVEQLHNQNNWLWTFGSTVISTLAVALAGLFGLFRYLRDQKTEREKQREVEQQRLTDRQDERRKHSEERFQIVVEGLGSESEAAQVGAAIMLRTFLRSGYEQVYSQAFDLAVAHLRLRNADPLTPEPLTSLSQALILVFRESFPLARNMHQLHQSPQLLDAARIQLDNAHLNAADLHRAWISEAYLRNAALKRANLSGASLYKSDLTGADLRCANLTKASLYRANFSLARMADADLSQTDLRGANLSQADLRRTNLESINIRDAILSGADLSFARLENTSLETAQALSGTKLYNVKGLSEEQLKACLAKGALLKENTTANPLPNQLETPHEVALKQI